MKNSKWRGQKVPDRFTGPVETWSCCVATLAMMLKLSESRVLQLLEDGSFERQADGSIRLQDAIIGYERALFGHGPRSSGPAIF
jgi:hypothetical protein